MLQGVVKWFNDKKGFGFITKMSGEEVFVHHTGIVGKRFKTLNEGDKVEFDIEEGDKGQRAISVHVIQ